MSRIILIALVLGFLGTTTALPFERPVIQLGSPRGLNENAEPTTYSPSANVLVLGEIKPPIGKRLKVCIYSVTSEGKLFRLTSADTPVTEGRFNINFDAPTGGWPIGPLRMEATLVDMKQVKTQINVNVVAEADAVAAVLPFSPAENSGITLDLAKARGSTVNVPVMKSFYLRGQMELEGIEPKYEGPSVVVYISAAKSTVKIGSSVALRQAKGKPVFEYEVELDAPKEPGTYSVRVQPTNVKTWWKVIEAKDPDFMLEVTETERK